MHSAFLSPKKLSINRFNMYAYPQTHLTILMKRCHSYGIGASNTRKNLIFETQLRNIEISYLYTWDQNKRLFINNSAKVAVETRHFKNNNFGTSGSHSTTTKTDRRGKKGANIIDTTYFGYIYNSWYGLKSLFMHINVCHSKN